MLNVPRNLQTFVSLLSGADPDAVERCGTLERFAAWVQATTLLITALFAFLGATYAVLDVLAAQAPASVLQWLGALSVGVVWGTFIFCLDFMCVRSMDGSMPWGRRLIFALPRVLMAGASAFLISIPIKAWLFQDEIAILMLDQKQQKKVAAASASSGQLAASQGPLDSATASVGRFAERLLGTPDAPEYVEATERIGTLEPRVALLQVRLATLRRELDAVARQADSLDPEAPGYAATQGRVTSARAALLRCAAERSATQAQLGAARELARTAEAAWRRELNDGLKAAEAERSEASRTLQSVVKTSEAERTRLSSELDSTYGKTGFVSKVVALWRLGVSSEVHFQLILGIFFLFFLVDSAPALAKTLANRAEYHAALEAVTQERLDYMNQASNARVVLHQRVVEIKRAAAEAALTNLEARVRNAGSTLDVGEARSIGRSALLALEDLS